MIYSLVKCTGNLIEKIPSNTSSHVIVITEPSFIATLLQTVQNMDNLLMIFYEQKELFCPT